MPDREKYIEVLSKTAKAVKELNEDAPIKISLECIEDILELLKEQEVKTGHWISVKDRLPTYAELKDDCVLVLFDDGTICSTGFDECIEGESIFGEWRQNFDPVTLGATDSYWMPLEGITHWMQIPKLMQEGG